MPLIMPSKIRAIDIIRKFCPNSETDISRSIATFRPTRRISSDTAG